MKYKEFCEQIIELVGGKNNIEAVVHCMTRLRFTLKDRNKAKTEDIKALKDVIDVVSNEVAYQIIIGTQVAQIHEELLQLLGMETSVEKKVKKNPVLTHIEYIVFIVALFLFCYFLDCSPKNSCIEGDLHHTVIIACIACHSTTCACGIFPPAASSRITPIAENISPVGHTGCIVLART